MFGVLAAHLSPSEKDFRAESFPKSSNIMRAIDMIARLDNGESGVENAHFILGVGPDAQLAIDREGVDPNNPKDYGEPTFLKFPAWTPEAQSHLVRICDSFGENPLVVSAGYRLDPRERGVKCFVHHFRDW